LLTEYLNRHKEDRFMQKILNWGVLSTAKIGWKQVVPAMQRSPYVNIAAVASRSLQRAQAMADDLAIAIAYGSYEELLSDPTIDAIYNPLPNHLHVPLTIQAMRAGKDVLCEKPIALTRAEAEQLLAVSEETGKRVEEAFMVCSNPQWLRVLELVEQGEIGKIMALQGAFSYFNNDSVNIRNQADIGGGGIYDIGCYLVMVSRMITGEEPCRLAASIDRDPQLKTDRLASVIMEFASGVQVTWLCSTQMVPFQRVNILGSKGRIEVEIPFNAPTDKENRIFIDDGSVLGNDGVRIETFAVADQYQIQGELFSKAILDKQPFCVSLENSIANMRIIDAIFSAAKTGTWQTL
jgi:predicted dehydrogenase